VFAVFSACKNRRRPGPSESRAFTSRLREENRPVIARWDDAEVIRLRGAAVAALVLALAPAAAADHGGPAKGKPDTKPAHGQPAAPQQAGSANGIVQSASARAVVVRQLDGSTVSVPVAPSTRVFVDGGRASLADVGAGYVATASWKAGKPAAELQAFAPSASVAVVQSVSDRAVVVSQAGGGTLTIHLTPRTRVLLDGRPVALRTVQAGDTLVLAAAGPGAKPASELRFLRPG
jgi:hypothetical protein